MENRFDLTLRVCGEGGEGVMSAGELTALGFARLGLDVCTFRTNPPEIKGGPAMFQMRIAQGPVRHHGDLADMLLCFNQEAWDLHSESLRPGGTLLYDPAECTPPERVAAERTVPLPLTRIARDEAGSARGKNVVAVGVMAAFAGMPLDAMAELVRQKWGRRKPEVLEANLKALELGYRFTLEHLPGDTALRLPAVSRRRETIMMSGNEAVAFGAVAGGLQTFFGYPITPASDIMEWLSRNLPAFGGVVIQTEDEIAAITACVGAGFAGAKAATSSSGPGVSLMVEGLGLAAMQEIPLVLYDAMRAGPSTGMPTKTEQGDLNLAVHGAHGEAPRIVIAPGDVESCFFTSVDAINLAERYQTPVIFLTDQTLAQRTQTFPAPDLSAIHTVDRLRPGIPDASDADSPDEGRRGYRRYELTADHVSPMAIPGRDNTPYVATGLEHNEHAHIDQTPAGHTVMSDKRARKIARAAEEPGWTEEYGDPSADVAVVCWGSTAGPVREACDILAARGARVKVLWLRMLWPMRMREILAFLEGCRLAIVPELNHSGQFAGLLKAELYGRSAVPIVQVNKVAGLPFGAHELADIIAHHASAPEKSRVARSEGRPEGGRK